MAAAGELQGFFGPITAGDVAEVTRLLDQAPVLVDSMDEKGWTPLMLASRCGRVDVLELLLERGADPNRALPSLGWSALHHAARQGQGEAVEVLLRHGAETSQTTQGGQTALIMACAAGHADVGRRLLGWSRGQGVDGRDRDGRTALWYACKGGWVGVGRELLGAGAQGGIVDCNGTSPHAIARRMGKVQCVAMLEWWEGEVERACWVDSARGLHTLHMLRHKHIYTPHTKQTTGVHNGVMDPLPACLERRLTTGDGLPSMRHWGREGEESIKGHGEAGMAHNLNGEGASGEEGEEQIGAMLGFVVRDLDCHLYTELLHGMRREWGEG